MMETILGKSYAKQLKSIPLSTNTAVRRIDDISRNKQQLESKRENYLQAN